MPGVIDVVVSGPKPTRVRFQVPALPPGAEPWARVSLEVRADPRTPSRRVVSSSRPAPLEGETSVVLGPGPADAPLVIVVVLSDGSHAHARTLGGAVSEVFRSGRAEVSAFLPLTIYPGAWEEQHPPLEPRRRLPLSDGDSSAASST